jgi:hypothetical protein
MGRAIRIPTVGRLAAYVTLLIGSTLLFSASAEGATGISVSPTSGPTGIVVHLRGNAAVSCVPQGFWGGFAFHRPGEREGPSSQMVPPMAADGSWAATVAVPAVLSRPRMQTGYVPVTPGTYQFSARVRCGTTRSVLAVTFRVTRPVPEPLRVVGIAPTPSGAGYWLARSDGAMSHFGDAGGFGSPSDLGVRLAAPMSGLAVTPTGRGYWLVGKDGGVFAFGDAPFLGSLPGLGVHPYAPLVGIAATSTGRGYWLAGADGGVFAFGDARNLGSAAGEDPAQYSGIVAIQQCTPSVCDEWLLVQTRSYVGLSAGGPSGGSFLLPDRLVGGTGSGIAATKNGHHQWLVALDGSVVESFPGTNYGSLPALGIRPAAPIVGISATPDGGGYWLVGTDGGVFAFGDAPFLGSDQPAPPRTQG